LHAHSKINKERITSILDPTRKTLKEGAIPTLNLPEKSHPSTVPWSSPPSRSTLMIKKKETATKREQLLLQKEKTSTLCFKSFAEFKTRVNELRLSSGWSISINDNSVEFKLLDDAFILPKYEIFTDFSLEIFIRVYGWMLPQNHYLLAVNQSSFKFISPSNFIRTLNQYKLCNGIDATSVSNSVNISRHIVPKKFSFNSWKTTSDELDHTYQLEYLRANTFVACRL